MLKWILTSFAILGFSQVSWGQDVVDAAVAAKNATTPVVNANATAATGFDKYCKTGYGAVFCPMAVMTLVQVGLTMATKSSAAKTQAAITSNGDFTTDPTSGLTPDNAALTTSVNTELAALAKKGYTFDPKTGTVTTPTGKYPSSAFASGRSMADAGIISKDQIGEIDSKIKSILKDGYHVVSVGVAGGGGGGSAAAPKYNYDDPYKPMAFGEKPQAPKTEGLTRTLASGESIGAGIDDIFKMVNRRYEAKSAEKIFVGQGP